MYEQAIKLDPKDAQTYLYKGSKINMIEIFSFIPLEFIKIRRSY